MTIIGRGIYLGTGIVVEGLFPPGVPTDVSASTVDDTVASVSFTAPAINGNSPITSYTAISSPGDITGTINQSGSGSITVNGLTTRTNYTFTVYATTLYASSPQSSASNAITTYGVPDAPIIGSATAIGSTSATVSYIAPAFNGGHSITSYTAVSNPGNHTGTINQSNSGTITVTGLSPDTNYTFTVYATNSSGDSSSSTSSNQVRSWTVPSSPSIGIPSVAGITSINVPFTAPTYNGGTAITSYTAVSNPGNITGTISQAGSGTITVTGLTKGTSYTFTVYATNSVGNGTSSSASSAVIPSTIPNAPTIGTPLNVSGSSTSIDVPFTAPSDNGGTVITSYTAVSSPGNFTSTIYQPTSGTITVTGLTQGTSYTFVVYATNARGNSSNSSASSTIIASTVPNAPTIGTPVNVSGSSTNVNVPFTSPTNNGGVPITSYTAVSSPGNITGTISQAGSGTITVTGLSKGTSYTFTVYATNARGNGASSNTSSEVTPSVVPNAPTIGTPVPASATSISVFFSAPADNGGVPITSYTATSTPGSFTASGSSSPIIVTGLTTGTNYTFTVYATNARGNSANSSASIAVAPAVVPDAPTLGTAYYNMSDSIVIPFTAPTYNGGAAITSYTATSTPDNISASVYQSGSGTIEVFGLSQNTTYTFTVYATNVIGNGASSSASNAVTTTPATQQVAYTTAGTYTWTCPPAVFSVSVVTVGGGGGCYFDSTVPGLGSNYYSADGSGGGGLGYKNNISVTPGQTYTVVAAAAGTFGQGVTRAGNGGDSYFINTSTVKGGGGVGAWAGAYLGTDVAGGTYVGDGGGNGGIGGYAKPFAYSLGGGGGGSGGYSGNGGAGGNETIDNGGDGAGGAGGGGAHSPGAGNRGYGGNGGGVGLLGQGSSGTGGFGSLSTYVGNSGIAGSGGSDITYGAGGGGNKSGGNSAGGAVRIIWPGNTRYFPSTKTVDFVAMTATTAIPYKALNISTTITAFTPVTFSGGVGTKTYSISPSLPASLSFNTSTAEITGTTSSSEMAATTYTVSGTDLFEQTPSSTFTLQIQLVGQQEYITGGTYSWICPADVYSVSVVCVGGGGGGSARIGSGGGGLGYKNNIAVVPGNSYTVEVGTYAQNGAAGNQSYFINTSTVLGGAGSPIGPGGIYIGDGGGNGGFGRGGSTNKGGGGGGAGGYSGTGGSGGEGGTDYLTFPALAGSGGGGSGGMGSASTGNTYQGGGGGGGVGIYGQGASGTVTLTARIGGSGGSGGQGAAGGSTSTVSNSGNGGTGGSYGGGGGGKGTSTSVGGTGAGGAVRIIWPGTERQFPSTRTTDE